MLFSENYCLVFAEAWNGGSYFVQCDEKDEKLQGKTLDFCALSLYNKITILQGGTKHG